MFSNFRVSVYFTAEDNQKKRKTNTAEQDKVTAAKKKAPDDKKAVGFDRGLQPEKILGEWCKYNVNT